jgi:phosphoribosylaminoimidazolecarboxamide formyltransferase / IMP cyclohydrolase
MNQESIEIKRALISVYDKDGVVEFAKNLVSHGVEILSTGGTARLLKENEVAVVDVSDFTGEPEIFGGRVKTLHPKVHGGILMRRGEDEEVAKEQGIVPIDLVVVNLYPFKETISKEGVTEPEAIEQIDIGGPTMLRSAAKNFKHVAVVTAIKDYKTISDELETSGGISFETRRNLAVKVFEKTSNYDEQITDYLKNGNGEAELLDLHYEKVRSLRYGENPHQKAVFFRDPKNNHPNVTNAKLLQSKKELSFNNIIDVDAALKIVTDFERPTVAVIKHTNPCGVATAEDITTAFKIAFDVDPLSAFGCIIAMNAECTEAIAQHILDNKLFVEIVAATSFEPAAIELLKKKKNMRILETGALRINKNQRDIKTVEGGILVQNADQYIVGPDDLKVVTKVQPTEAQMQGMLYARNVVKHVKSNAVVFAKVPENDGIETVVAIGAGQMSRVDSVFIATHKGGDRIKGSVMASDAFFPFADGVEEAHKAGVAGIIQPGGSIRDEEVIAKADELGLSMVFTGIRSFKH